MKLESITIEEFKKEIYLYYLEIFPEEERKSLREIKRAYKNGYMKLIKITEQKQFVGFMVLDQIKENGYIDLDYLAILPQYRSMQYGTKSLKLLFEEQKESKGIFIEIEKVGLGKNEKENLVRQKRKDFYENLGFKELNFDLLLYDVIYTPLLFFNKRENEEIIIEEIFDIYNAIMGERSIKRNCKIIKNR